MKRWYVLAATLVIVALATSSASAQQQPRRPGGGGGGFGANPMMLLGQESVQQELKMSEDQISKVKAHQEKSLGSFRDFGNLSQEERQKKMQEIAQENEKFLGEVLKPEQKKRLDQIALQQRGGDALTDPKVQTALGITDDQKEKIKAIQEDFRKTLGDLRSAGGGGDRAEMAKKMQEMRTANSEKMLKLLTDDQKKKWEEMAGPKFTGKIEFRRPGGNNNN
jgi:hypothetical protein